jgi:anti-anti-sigma regulatory factor
MTATIPPYQLPAVMTLEDCEKLRDQLNTSYDAAVTLQCDQVTRLPGLAAQLILAAQRSWQTRGLDFELANVSLACQENITALGLDQLLHAEGAK